MRKILLIFAFLIFFGFVNDYEISYANPESNVYGKVYNDCKLFSKASVDEYLFIVPESYFVVVLDELDSYYRVQYKNYFGYVEKDKVEICNFIPNVKFLEGVTFDINNLFGTQIWSKPSDLSNTLTTISAGTCGITYIGNAYGDIPSGGVGNLWYYVIYTPNEFSTNVYEGYVYSENTINLSNVVVNLESNKTEKQELNDKNILFSNGLIKTIIVSIIAIPIILFILFILYKFIKIYQNKTNKDKNNNKYSSELKMEIDDKNNIKEEISKIVDNGAYIKKKKLDTEKINYLTFPHYENEDDWL